jgi:hypothetical protein
MTHLPKTGMCQGNFAASVKEILPIYECGVLARATSFTKVPREILRIRSVRSLTGYVPPA